MLKKITLFCALVASASQLQARGLDLKLADEMAEITYLAESSTFGYGGSDIGLGVFFTENDDMQLNASMMITGNPAGNNRALQFGIGGKLMYTSIETNNILDDEEFGALAVAGQVRYVVPSSTPVAFLAAVYYAPGITSFSGADNYSEVLVAFELEVTPSARAYIGFRDMEYELENGLEIELDEGGHVGLKFDF